MELYDYDKLFVMENRLDVNADTIVAYQGVPGAFSEQATVEYFGETVKTVNVPSFEDVILALENGQADYGVLPVENSSAGFVLGSYDLLLAHDVFITGEIIIRIQQALLGLPETRIEDIDTVYSHPQGLLQSKRFLSQYQWKQIAYDNTAMAAKKVKEDGLKNHAAVASVRAAKIYGLSVLKENVNYADTNATRFFILRKCKVYQKDAKKITISFSLQHKSGTLYTVLGHFIKNDINMTSIESRPLENSPWEYQFFISFEGNLQAPNVRRALDFIQNDTISFKLLGNY